MSELKKLRAKHEKEVQELQEGCDHPSSNKMSVKAEEGVWGEALFCSVCGKRLVWTEEPTRKYEITSIPVEWIE